VTENSKQMKEKCENHQKCMQMIQAVLDGSASAEEVKHFRDNFEECKPCIDGYHLEKSIKEAMQVKVEKKCCPQATIVDIRAKVGLGLMLLGFVVVEVKLFHYFFSC
jgi:anti-sigma factor (TIGR02949 family)